MTLVVSEQTLSVSALLVPVHAVEIAYTRHLWQLEETFTITSCQQAGFRSVDFWCSNQINGVFLVLFGTCIWVSLYASI